MKKIVLLFIACVTLLTSCASLPDYSPNGVAKLKAEREQLEANKAQMKKAAEKATPAKGEVQIFNLTESPQKTYSASAFNAAIIYTWLDEHLNFSEIMDDQQKIDFTKALFSNLEDVNTVNDVRYVVLGKFFTKNFFDNEDCLKFKISRVQLQPGAIPGVDYAYKFVSNLVIMKNNQTGEQDFYSMRNEFSETTCVMFYAIPYENGVLVPLNHLNKENVKYNSRMTLVQKGNLMDTYVKDGITENDSVIEYIYKEITNKDDKDLSENDYLAKHFLVPLNYGLYLLKQNKIEEAKALWNSIDLKKLSAKSENAKKAVESYKPVFESQIPNLINIVSNY